MGREAEGEIWVRHTEGTMICPSLSSRLHNAFTLHLLICPITAFHCCPCYNLFSVRCTTEHILHAFIPCMVDWIHSRASLTLLLSQHLCLGGGGLNAATVREHGSNSPAMAALPDSSENNITTRALIFSSKNVFHFPFRGRQWQDPVHANMLSIPKAVVPMWFLWWWKQSHQMLNIT